MTRTHFGQHGEDCFGCKLHTITLAPVAHPTTAKDRRWQADMDAYGRLRGSGVQPPAIDGSAVLESRAEERYEVETGHVLNAGQRRQVQQLTAEIPHS